MFRETAAMDGKEGTLRREALRNDPAFTCFTDAKGTLHRTRKPENKVIRTSRPAKGSLGLIKEEDDLLKKTYGIRG